MTRTARLLIFAGLGTFVLLVFFVPALIGLLADWYWYDALGYQTVFLQELVTKLVLGLGAGIVAGAFVYLNLRVSQRGLVPDPVILQLGQSAGRLELTSAVRRMSLPAAAVVGILVGLAAPAAWLVTLRFLHRTPFGEVDPVFGRDIGYYVFTLPVLEWVTGFAVTLLVLTLIAVTALYVMRGDVIFRGRRITIEPSSEVHLGALIAALFAVTAARLVFVDLPHLLYSETGPLVGASYADLNAARPALTVAAGVALVAAAFVLWGAFRRRLALNVVVAIVAYVAVRTLGGALFPGAVQRLSVLPNELAREAPQLERHIAATRHAWGLDEVEVRDLTGEATLSLRDIEANAATIRNVRLWDRDPLLQTFGQLQEIRTYYDFVSVDNDRYVIDGEYRQVMLSARELNTASLPTRTFINERLTFTHGMGVTLGPVNRVTVEGLPVLFIKDLPPASSVSVGVTRPQIYYGELSSDWVFVNTRQPEFDYPSANGNVETKYEGTGGVRAGSMFRRAILAAHFGSLKIVLSQDIEPDSRALYHRDIVQRAAKALPFLWWDSDPYLVVTDAGRLKWVIDAYTTTDRYPYAQRAANGINYMRNSVKVVIDAYDGDVRGYVADTEDPIIQTYGRIFEGIFAPLDSMPPDLRAHIRYPEDLFRVQTQLYTTYHMGEPDVFYHREDQWQIPAVERAGSRDPFLRHIVMRLPGEDREEFILMTPFTPRQKDNLAAWMVARNDGAHYGELVVYRFPRQSLVFGPRQIVNRMNQDTEISRQVTLWDQRGSEVIRGNLLVIPIEESLIYVQPIYLRAEGGQIPELKRVIVAYQTRVVMEETLEAGLAQLFDGSLQAPLEPPSIAAAALPAQEPTLPTGPTDAVSDLIARAAQHYERAVAAQRAGDWARYGEEIRLLGEVLERLRAAGGALE